MLYSGPIKTPLLMDFLDTPEKLHRRMIHNPMGRFGEAVEQAKAVVFRSSSTSFFAFAHVLSRFGRFQLHQRNRFPGGWWSSCLLCRKWLYLIVGNGHETGMTRKKS